MTGRIFVSYSHDDRAWREAFRQMLGPALERFGLELWADDHVRSGDRWERVIDDALADARLGLLLVTPAHLMSSFSWEVEVPALLDAGVAITWVLVEDCLWEDRALLLEFQGLQDPSREGALADHPSPKKELARLCRKLRNEHLPALATTLPRIPRTASRPAAPAARLVARQPGKVFGPVPRRPAMFVARPEDFDDLRTQLVGGVTGTVGVTGTPSVFGLHGPGGIGKTVLASELTRDPETLAHFPDGVFWVSVGERPDVVGAQRRLAAWLGGDPEAIRSPLQGAKVLGEMAAGKQCLLVLDDVWSLGVAQAFAVTGPIGRLLLTTRDELLLERVGAATVRLDVLSPAAASELLAGLTGASPAELPPEADRVLEATGRVALAVALVGAAVGRGNQPWGRVEARLAEAGEVFAAHPYADTFKALEVATASLDGAELSRYQALACFPEDTVIPPATITRLWQLDERELEAQLERLDDLKLARRQDAGLVFHDLERNYLLLHAEAAALAHEQLLAVHRPAAGGDWYRLDPADPYLWDHLTYHLAAAGRHHELLATVTDPAWLAARITRDGTLAAEGDLSEALRWEPADPGLHNSLRRIQQVSHLLDRARTFRAVPATLATHFWALRDRVDLGRLDIAFGHQPAVSWVAGTASPRLLRTLLGRAGSTFSVSWSPDGGRLASGADDGTVYVWDAATGTELRAISGHTGRVWSVAWSPDGTQLASGADDGVRVWNSATDLRSAPAQTVGVWSVAWSPDGRQLASGGVDGTVRVWDATTGAELRDLPGTAGRVWSVAWSRDGGRLASGAEDGTVCVWDAATGANLRVLSEHTGAVWSVVWSPDGTRLASGAQDGKIRVWNANTGAKVRAPSGHAGGVWSLAWSPEGARLASGGVDGAVRVRDAASGEQLQALSGHGGAVWSVAWSPDGSRLASAAHDGNVRVWAANPSGEEHSQPGHADWVRSVAWSPDGSRLASSGDDRTVRVWDASTGAQLRTLSGHPGTVWSVNWSPDGTRLASGSEHGRILLRDATTGAEVLALSDHGRWVRTVAWSPDGTRLASGGEDGEVRLRDANSGIELRALSGHAKWVRAVAWSPDGSHLASGGDDRTVRLWDAATGAELLALSGHSSGVSSVAWSPDGSRLASGSDDRSVRVWDAATGTELRAFQGHAGKVRSIAWSPDGNRLASGAADGGVQVWDSTTGSVVLRLVAGEQVSAVDFSIRGALAVGVDRTVIVYCS